MTLEQVGWEEAAVKYPQASLEDANFTQIKHEDEFTLIFDKLSVFQEGVIQNICIVAERVDNMEAPTLTGLTYQGSSQMEALVEQI